MYKTFLSLLTVLTIFAVVDTQAQCTSNTNDALCIERISQNNTFVKSYKLNHRVHSNKEFSSVLAKDTHYYLNLCEDGQVSTNVVINVYNTKRKLIASNQTKNTILPELTFECQKTGVYYLEFKANPGAADCGIGALSFRRTSKNH
ncbi:MAG: hypothetical protein OER04_12885 [Cyclobacteriaceae bacterium]|nr:hypothetical protein [Cyclobacteriaceae bacterium]